MIDYAARFRKTLQVSGDLYEPDDIFDAIHEGEMQAFVHGDSMVVTSIIPFPKRRVLYMVATCGRLEDLDFIYTRMVQFAKDQAISRIIGEGRVGWSKICHRWGFKVTGATFAKELD